MKEVLVLCGCFPEKHEGEYLDNTTGLPQIAADRLQKNIINGIRAAENVTPYVLTAPFVGYYPKGYKKLFLKSDEYTADEVKYKVVGFPTIKGLETYIKSVGLYRSIVKWCKQSADNRNIIIYSHYAGFMRALGKAKRKFPDINACCVITDMPELSAQKPVTFLQKCRTLPRETMFRITYRNLPYINYFALLSKHMAPELSISDDQFCVVECMCDPDKVNAVTENAFLRKRKENGIYFAYSGMLSRKYGMRELLEAFASIENPNLHLWICGDGDAKEDVLASASRDPRIEFFGCLKYEDVLAFQQAADILINPRSSEGIFTKYSFPSKTIEYMLAGKPVIAYKLMGIPDEYDDYLLYVEESKTGLLDAISKYGVANREELLTIGRNNRKFAVENKNYVVQTKKILLMMGLDNNVKNTND